MLDPIIVSTASDLTVECDGAGNDSDLQAWLSNNGGAVATDAVCGGVTWTNDFTTLNEGCGESGSTLVTFTATDGAGNSSSTSASFTIVDTTAPVMLAEAIVLTVPCGINYTPVLNGWLNSNGFAQAFDGCSAVTWSNDYVGLTSACGNAGEAVVTFTATDACGNSTSTTSTFVIEDTTRPVITQSATNLIVECDGSGNVSDLSSWLENNGGATATDACGNVTWSNNFNGLSDGCGATGSATVIFTATDDCGNERTTSATFTIQDTTAPSLDVAASDETVECDGAGNGAALNAWLDAHGGASVSEMCGDVTWSHDFEALSDECGATGSATVTFTATDACGHATTTSATFTIVDTTDPVLMTSASNLTVECDGAGNVSELEAWLNSNGGAVVEDACSDVTWSNNFTALSDECGGEGTATVLFTATDACGNVKLTIATFHIEDSTAPTIEAPEDYTVTCADNIVYEDAVASDVCAGVTVTVETDTTSVSEAGVDYPLTVVATPAITPGFTTYRFYVNMQNADDRMSAVYGNDQSALVLNKNNK
jgi:hypothetical protein